MQMSSFCIIMDSFPPRQLNSFEAVLMLLDGPFDPYVQYARRVHSVNTVLNAESPDIYIQYS